MVTELINCCGTTCDKQVLREQIRQMVIDAYLEGRKDGVRSALSPSLTNGTVSDRLNDYLSKLNLSEK